MLSAPRFTTGVLVNEQTANGVSYVTAGKVIIANPAGQRIDCAAGDVARLRGGAIHRKQIAKDYEEFSLFHSDTAVVM